MMHSIILWFYCLPVSDAVFLIFTATILFLLLRNNIGNSRYWKLGSSLLFFLWIAITLYTTLGLRTEGDYISAPVLTPFYSYYAVLHSGPQELYRANFMNVILFYPIGLLGYELLPKQWRRVWKTVFATCFPALLSIGIEYAQYRFHLGLAETDDVIHNILGALLGGLACWIPVDPIMTLFKWR